MSQYDRCDHASQCSREDAQLVLCHDSDVMPSNKVLLSCLILPLPCLMFCTSLRPYLSAHARCGTPCLCARWLWLLAAGLAAPAGSGPTGPLVPSCFRASGPLSGRSSYMAVMHAITCGIHAPVRAGAPGTHHVDPPLCCHHFSPMLLPCNQAPASKPPTHASPRVFCTLLMYRTMATPPAAGRLAASSSRRPSLPMANPSACPSTLSAPF